MSEHGSTLIETEESAKTTSPSEEPLNLGNLSAGQKGALSRVLNEIKEEAKGSLERIKSFEAQVYNNSASQKGLKSTIEDYGKEAELALKKIQEQKEQIQNFHSEIFDEQESESSTDPIPSIEDEIKNAHEEINNILDELKTKEEKFNAYYKKIFGEADAEGNIAGGLEKEIDKNKKRLDDLYNQKEVAFNTLFEKVEGLLPGATSIGLAKAYEDQKKNFFLPNIGWSALFIISTSVMIGFGAWHISDTTSFWEALSKVISKLPFFLPAIWLAAFASKQQSQNKRLAQEYAFKEAMAKSFDGFKKQIEALDETEESQQVLLQLLSGMVKMTSENPSDTLENNSHKDSPPLVEKIFDLLKNKSNGEVQAEPEK